MPVTLPTASVTMTAILEGTAALMWPESALNVRTSPPLFLLLLLLHYLFVFVLFLFSSSSSSSSSPLSPTCSKFTRWITQCILDIGV